MPDSFWNEETVKVALRGALLLGLVAGIGIGMCLTGLMWYFYA